MSALSLTDPSADNGCGYRSVLNNFSIYTELSRNSTLTGKMNKAALTLGGKIYFLEGAEN
jgi:hypothetical protein